MRWLRSNKMRWTKDEMERDTSDLRRFAAHLGRALALLAIASSGVSTSCTTLPTDDKIMNKATADRRTSEERQTCGSHAEPEREPLAPFQLRSLSGRLITNEDYRGRVLLLDLWATWCAPCEASLPFYASLLQRFSGQGLAVLALSVDEHEDDVRAFLEQHPVPFDVARLEDGTLASRFGANTMPTLLIVGRDGRVIVRHCGFEDRDRVQLERWVRSTLGS
ncbi:MAG: TlpA family protein disulfide reductase [Deltaproteobacteria bacterium]|nr:TlpA family protein disulfide reductase [Deltaproteobacteria bacterium]